MGFKPAAKVTTSGTHIVLEVVILRIEPLAACAEHRVEGDNRPIWVVRSSPAFLFTLQPSPTRATGQLSNKMSTVVALQITLTLLSSQSTNSPVETVDYLSCHSPTQSSPPC